MPKPCWARCSLTSIRSRWRKTSSCSNYTLPVLPFVFTNQSPTWQARLETLTPIYANIKKRAELLQERKVVSALGCICVRGNNTGTSCVNKTQKQWKAVLPIWSEYHRSSQPQPRHNLTWMTCMPHQVYNQLLSDPDRLLRLKRPPSSQIRQNDL